MESGQKVRKILTATPFRHQIYYRYRNDVPHRSGLLSLQHIPWKHNEHLQ